MCFCYGLEHLRQHAHTGDRSALSHGVDEARECILREGDVASVKMSYVTDKVLEVRGRCSKRLLGQRTKMHCAMLLEDVLIQRLLDSLATPIGNTSALPRGPMPESYLMWMCSH